MAVFDAVWVPSTASGTKVAALAASASSAEQLLGPNQIFAIVGSDAFHIKFGVTGMAAAAATDFRIPANTVIVMDTGQQFSHIRVFNSTAAAIDVYILELSRTS